MTANDPPQEPYHFTLAPDGAGYVASYCQGESRETIVSLWLPRHVVDGAVLNAARIALDLAADGTVMVYAEGSGSQTLTRAALETLIAATLDVLDPETDWHQLPILEAQLEAGLAAVRQAGARLRSS